MESISEVLESKVAVIQPGRCIIGARSFFLGSETSQVDTFVIDPDSGKEGRAVRVAVDALEPYTSGSTLVWPSVQTVLPRGGKPKVDSTVVELVPVDMVNLDIVRDISDDTVHRPQIVCSINSQVPNSIPLVRYMPFPLIQEQKIGSIDDGDRIRVLERDKCGIIGIGH